MRTEAELKQMLEEHLSKLCIASIDYEELHYRRGVIAGLRWALEMTPHLWRR